MGSLSFIPFLKAVTLLMRHVDQDAARSVTYVMQAVAERVEVLECERFPFNTVFVILWGVYCAILRQLYSTNSIWMWRNNLGRLLMDL